MANVAALVIEARRHLAVSQGKLGTMLGSSARTGQRWERGGMPPAPQQLHQLAALVHPFDPELAARIATAGGSTLAELGIALPPAPAPGAGMPNPTLMVDSVVCAAADAMQLVPEAVRPALRAAFRRARLAGLSVEAVDAALHGVEKEEAR